MTTSEFDEYPEMADFCLTQCNMTALDYGRRIGRHENRTPTLMENRNSQVLGDSDISSEGVFGILVSLTILGVNSKETFQQALGRTWPTSL